MIKKIYYLLFGIIIMTKAFGQKPYLPNGGMFTPEGDIKALLIFVGFSHNIFVNGDSIPFNHQHYANWDISQGQDLPPYVNSLTGEMDIFHEDIQEFSKPNTPVNISDYYNEMSLGKFNFMAECLKDPNTDLPVRIDIDPKGKNSIKDFNRAVLDKVYQLYPDFDFAPFDIRENNPNYSRNTANTRSDGKPDCIIFIYRNHNGMPHQVFKKKRLVWGGGVATSYLNGYKSPWESYSFDNTGFTLSDESGKNGDAFMSMFLHEIAHKLYNSPHYNGANGTVGNYFFYPDISYGMMNSTNFTNITANGWERWVLGWINLDKQDIDKTQSIDSIGNREYSFILRDYVTSGDALRLPIPNYPNSFLWIENHQNKSKMDRNLFGGQVLTKIGDTVPKLSKGIYAYVERISPNRNILPKYGNKHQSNGLRFLHADGNWDYSYNGVSKSWDNYFNNPIASLKKAKRNPFAGTNPFMRFINDFPKGWQSEKLPDGKITYKSSVHGGYIESVPFIMECNERDTMAVYGFSGGNTVKSSKFFKNRNPFFKSGDKLSLSSGHPVYGLVNYDRRKGELEHTIINGMHVDFKSIDHDSYLVTVRYNDFNVKSNLRLSGNLKIEPNYLNQSDYSLILNSKIDVLVDESGTVNSHKAVNNKFINPTELILNHASKVLMKTKSKFIVNDNSILILKRGSYVKMERGSRIIIGKNAKLIIEEGAVIDKHNRAKIIYK